MSHKHEHDKHNVSEHELHEHSHCCEHDEEDDDDDENPIAEIIKIAFSGVLAVLIAVFGDKLNIAPRLIIVALGYLVISYDIIFKSIKSIIHGHLLDENFLMSVASIGALFLGEFPEAIAVIAFYKIGELFEDRAVGKSKENIRALTDIRPDHANIEKEGGLVQVNPSDVSIGTEIVVLPGERVPIDGVIVKGNSALNTSALTGESLPEEVSEGDSVLSGSINLSGIIRLKTTTDFTGSTLSRILTLVRDSAARKSRSENFITKFARIYTPIVCISAVLLAVIPPLVNILSGMPAGFTTWIYRALSFLCVSCPCALVISIPLSFFAGIGCAGKYGILVKGSGFMEALAKTKAIAFDKTGTMTKGVFEVTGIHHNTIAENALLELAAYAESASTHPIAKSILRAYNKPIDQAMLETVEEIGGNGVISVVKSTALSSNGEKITVACGNDKLMTKLGIKYESCSHPGTVVHIALNNEYAGHILINDVIKEHAGDAIRELRALGISRTVMLTGDSRSSAEKIAAELGINETFSELLPADKVEKVEELLASKASAGDTLAFVGDGINDAPVLTRADIGIAMGGLGSDAAIEASDIVLMDDDPTKIALAIKIAKKTLLIAHENIYFAIGIKVLCLILTATGITGMWLAIFADVGVMALAVLNAMRALIIRSR